MNEPLIGPNGPLRIWSPDEADAPAERTGENASTESTSAESASVRRAGLFPLDSSRGDSALDDDASLRRVMVALWVVCVVTVQVAGFVYQPLNPPENLYLFGFWLGTAWAGWAAAVWVSSRWASRPLTRVVFLVVMFAWHGLGMSVVNDETAARYVVMLGGYGMIQAVVFHWVGIPRWKILCLPIQRPVSPFDTDSAVQEERPVESRDVLGDAIRIDNRGDVTRQFGIGDLIAITTLVAVLITAGKSYETLLADSFWWGLIVGEAVLLAVAVLSVMSGLAQRLVTILGLFVLAVATGVGGSVLLDFIETLVSTGIPISLWPIYAVLMTTFSILLVGFAALSMTPLQTSLEPLEAVTEQELVENDKSDREPSSRSPL
jgi:hypothetical protein